MSMIFVDARDFKQAGGWKLDRQFITTVGFPYLLAAGIGTPVEKAQIDLAVETAGRYNVWVRTKDWLAEYSPGKFHVEMPGFVGRPLGEDGREEWHWEHAGQADLNEGKTVLSLIDDSGYYGRVSTILLTDDLTYIPPEKTEDIRLLRRQLLHESIEPEQGGEYDIIVVGAGVAGCLAAIAAARQGMKTLLLDEREAPGGNALLGVPVNGATFQPNIRETGLVEELARLSAAYGMSNSKTLLKMFEAEPLLTYRPYSALIGAVTENAQRIDCVKIIDVNTDREYIYRGKIFIDCSGDGWLAYFAGAEMRRGREAASEFGEESAPEKADGNLMSGVNFGEAFLYRAVNTGKPCPYTPPAWAYRFPTEEAYSRPVTSSYDYDFTAGTWFHEHHGDVDEFTQPEKARDEIIRIILGVWDYMKNVWWKREKAVPYALKTVSTTLAKRETNRIMGDYILTQNDIESTKDFPDKIAYGGWPIDMHNHAGIFGKESPYEVSREVDPYPIPYRCTYSKNISNLMFAGRNISTTHIALGSVRVQGTLAVIGEAVGTAAAMCVQKQITPRALGQTFIHQLQQKLNKNDLYIPGIVNEDPADFARSASFSASSVNSCRSFGKENVHFQEFASIEYPRLLCIQRGLYHDPACIWLAVSCHLPKTEYTLSFNVKCSDVPDPEALTDLYTVTKTVVFGEIFPFPHGVNQYNQSPFGAVKWVKIELTQPIEKPYLWLSLPPVKDLCYGLMEKDPYERFTTFAVEKSGCKEEKLSQAFYLQPPLTTPGEPALAQRYEAKNVINGINRITGDQPNMWASEMSQQMPQWLEASWDTPHTINCVYLAFDTNLDMNNATSYDKRPFQCVSDYEICVFDGKEWHTVVSEQDNFQRRRIHYFSEISAYKVRVRVLKTHGDLAARIFEMRVYHEDR